MFFSFCHLHINRTALAFCNYQHVHTGAFTCKLLLLWTTQTPEMNQVWRTGSFKEDWRKNTMRLEGAGMCGPASLSGCVCVCVWVSLCVRGNYNGMCGPVSLSGCVCVCVWGGGGCLFVSEVITVGCVGEGTYSSCSAVWDRLITTKHYFSATFCCFPCISWAFFNFVLGFVLNLSLSFSPLSKRDPVFSRNQ